MFVLVVDDDPVLRAIHLVILSGIQDASAVGAGSLAEARSIIDQVAPELIVLDLKLPDGTGLDLIQDLERTHQKSKVVIVSSFLDDYEGQLIESDRVRILGKPVLRNVFEKAIREMMAPNENSLGPPPFTLVDYIQISCMGGYNVDIRAMTEVGRGVVNIRGGALWAAFDQAGSGKDALRRLVCAEDAVIRVVVGSKDTIDQNITERWDFALLDAACLNDEAAVNEARNADHAGNVRPSGRPRFTLRPHAATVPPAGPLEELTFDDLVETAIRAVVARDLTTAVNLLERAHALRPDDLLVQHRLLRLKASQNK